MDNGTAIQEQLKPQPQKSAFGGSAFGAYSFKGAAQLPKPVEQIDDKSKAPEPLRIDSAPV